MKRQITQNLKLLRAKKPLVMNITNFVVMNNTANALLALGGSPMMIHAKTEVEQALKLADSLVVNIGTVDEYWAESMIIATKKAQKIGVPWVLDPIGAGISDFRNDILQELIANKPTVIRGNASEIFALNSFSTVAQKGMDSTMNSEQVIDVAQEIYRQTGAIVCISGEKDYIVGRQLVEVNNGSPMMTTVTGLGCSATAIIGGFLGIKKDVFIEAISGVSIFSLAGEMAAKKARGPGNLQSSLYDKLYLINESNIAQHLAITVH